MFLQTVRKPSYGTALTNLYEDCPKNLSTLIPHVTSSKERRASGPYRVTIVH